MTVGPHHEIVEEAIEEGLPVHKKARLLDLLTTLVSRRRFILWFTIGVMVLTAVVVLLVSNKYTAETLVLPPPPNSSLSSVLQTQMNGSAALASIAGAGLGIKSPADMYVALFRSRTVEDALVSRFGLMTRYHKKRMSDARRTLEARSSVEIGAKDGLIRIDVTDPDPQVAAKMANAYVEEFQKLSANLAISEASQRRIFFEKQLREANQNLATAEEGMKQTQQTTGMLQLDSQARSLIESAASLRGQIVAKEVEIQAMRSYAAEDNAQLMVAEQVLSALRAQLAKLSGTGENPGSEILLPKGNIPQAGMEYLNKLRDVRYYETIQQLIARQLEMAKLDEAREGAVIQVADVAVPPDKKSSPKRTVIVLGAGFAALVLSMLWVIVAQEVRSLISSRKLDVLQASFHEKPLKRGSR